MGDHKNRKTDQYEDNGWNEYEKLVLYRLDTIEKNIGNLFTKVNALQLKSGLIGLLGGLIPAVSVAIYIIIRIQ